MVERLPAPVGDADAPARAMIFDSVYDAYRGVVTYVRMVDGKLEPRERIQMMSTRATHDLLEIGVSSPEPTPTKGLGVGEVGYLITGVKDVRQSKVGDTVTTASKPAAEPLAFDAAFLQIERCDRAFEELHPARAGFDQHHGHIRMERSDHQTRKSRPAPKIEPRTAGVGTECFT